MKYSNEELRRQDRLLEESTARELLSTGEYGVLSMACAGKGAYGIPMSYVWDGEETIYLHGAPEGKKLACMEVDRRVSFCVVGRTNVMADIFSTEYESIVLEGEVSTVSHKEEQLKALMLFVDKYSPEFREGGQLYAEKALARTAVFRLVVSQWSGKAKFYKRGTK